VKLCDLCGAEVKELTLLKDEVQGPVGAKETCDDCTKALTEARLEAIGQAQQHVQQLIDDALRTCAQEIREEVTE